LLRSLSRARRGRISGRAVVALTANRVYALDGVRHGAKLASIARRLRVGRGYRIGLNTWYVVPGRSVDGLLKVRNGVIDEIGIANRSLIAGRRATRAFLASFN
jgi:hypothetical protein